jgi:hypothetical protein
VGGAGVKLEVGKKYKTCGGEIVECIAVWSKSVKDFQATCSPIKASRVIDYRLDGTAGGGECTDDILSEYIEPVRVADYLTPDPFSMNVSGKCSHWRLKTHPIGQQPEGSVMVPGSERSE